MCLADNLAPETDRDQKAISYNKGCYLGQEPIARIDGMGHVNRKLFRAQVISAPAGNETDSDDLPQITSMSSATDADPPALLLLRVDAVADSKRIDARSVNGEAVALQLQ